MLSSSNRAFTVCPKGLTSCKISGSIVTKFMRTVVGDSGSLLPTVEVPASSSLGGSHLQLASSFKILTEKAGMADSKLLVDLI